MMDWIESLHDKVFIELLENEGILDEVPPSLDNKIKIMIQKRNNQQNWDIRPT
jgi:hypothetical protein